MSIRSRVSPLVRAPLAWAAPSIGSVTTQDRVVALTFDDGPDPAGTPSALEALARMGARATFFMVAERAEHHPDLVRRVLDEGHEVGLHGADHRSLPRARLRDVDAVVRRGRRRLEAVTGGEVGWFRPAFGHQDVRAYAIARAAHLRVVAWTTTPRDWLDVGIDDLVGACLAGLAPGAIVLLHDGLLPESDGEPTPRFDRGEMLAAVIGAVGEAGWQSVTVSELMTRGPAVTYPWFVPGLHRWLPARSATAIS